MVGRAGSATVRELLPEVEDDVPVATTLQEIGAEMERARPKAPRRPSQPSALKKTIDAVVT